MNTKSDRWKTLASNKRLARQFAADALVLLVKTSTQYADLRKAKALLSLALDQATKAKNTLGDFEGRA